MQYTPGLSLHLWCTIFDNLRCLEEDALAAQQVQRCGSTVSFLLYDTPNAPKVQRCLTKKMQQTVTLFLLLIKIPFSLVN